MRWLEVRVENLFSRLRPAKTGLDFTEPDFQGRPAFIRGGTKRAVAEPEPETSEPVEPVKQEAGDSLMNRRQLIDLWVGVGLFVLSFCVPPWHRGNNYEGFHFLFTEQGYHGRIDVSMLLSEWLVIAVVTGASIFSLRRTHE